MKRLLKIAFSLLIAVSVQARADMFGGDVAVLMQILNENVQQLLQLESILNNAKGNLELTREINAGINDSLNLIRTISPYIDPGQFSELKKVEEILRKFGSIYGTVVNSPDALAQSTVDRSVAEAIAMNSAIYDYTKNVDDIGESIKSYSHAVSPGGAQKLTAESLGVVIHVMNQQLRAQGTMLKLQAQALAQTNKREKDYTAQYLKASSTLSDAMKTASPAFQAPRF